MQRLCLQARFAQKKSSPRIIVDNKLKGAYAESDLDKRTIKVNVKRHFQKGYKRINPAADGHEKIYSTIAHELLHFKHPNMREMNIRKLEKKTTRRMSSKRKEQLLDKLK